MPQPTTTTTKLTYIEFDFNVTSLLKGRGGAVTASANEKEIRTQRFLITSFKLN